MSQTREPLTLTAGDTISFTRSLADYPASDGWVLTYEMRSGGGRAIEFSATADVDDHVVLVAAATTALWLPDDYLLAGFVALNGARFEVYRGTLPVLANTAAMPGDEPVLTFAQQMVAALQKTILARANGMQETTFGETRFRYWTPEQLDAQLAYWEKRRQVELDKENALNGRPSRNKIQVQFNITQPGLVSACQQFPFR